MSTINRFTVTYSQQNTAAYCVVPLLTHLLQNKDPINIHICSRATPEVLEVRAGAFIPPEIMMHFPLFQIFPPIFDKF